MFIIRKKVRILELPLVLTKISELAEGESEEIKLYIQTYISLWNNIFIARLPSSFRTRRLPKDYLREFLFSGDEWSRAFGKNIFFFLYHLFFKVRRRFSHGGVVLPRLVCGWILPICPRRRVCYLFHLPGLARRTSLFALQEAVARSRRRKY